MRSFENQSDTVINNLSICQYLVWVFFCFFLYSKTIDRAAKILDVQLKEAEEGRSPKLAANLKAKFGPRDYLLPY